MRQMEYNHQRKVMCINKFEQWCGNNLCQIDNDLHWFGKATCINKLHIMLSWLCLA